MKIDWFALLFVVLGIMNLLSGCYEWTWWWRLARGGYLPNQIGWEKTRALYIIGGAGCLGVGIALFIQSILGQNSILWFIVGFTVAAVMTVALFNARGNQSFGELIRNIRMEGVSGKSRH